jgi:TldD protein
MNKQIASKIIDLGLSYGAEFVELYIEESRESSVSFKQSQVENAGISIEYGVG